MHKTIYYNDKEMLTNKNNNDLTNNLISDSLII